MFTILSMIILVAAFNIISSLIMLVKDKSADIAVLRTMGQRAEPSCAFSQSPAQPSVSLVRSQGWC
jgi:hypothetical protein